MRFALRALVLSLLLLSPTAAEVTPEQRADLSRAMLTDFIKNHGAPQAVSDTDRVQGIFSDLVAHTQRSDIQYRLSVVEDSQVNAQSFPDGQVVVFTGLLQALPEGDPDPIAFVLAHEIAHLENCHAERRLENQMSTGLIVGLVTAAFSRRAGYWLWLVGDVGASLITSGYSRDMEGEADRKGLELMVQAGYQPEGALAVFRLFEQAGGRARVFPTHPGPDDRLKDTMIWLDENRVSPAVALATLEPVLDKDLGDIEQMARESSKAQVVSTARGMLGAGASNLVDSRHRFDQLLSARDSLPEKAGSQLSSRLSRLEDRYLYDKVRTSEALASYLWLKIQSRPLQPGASDSLARQTLVDLIAVSQAIRADLEKGTDVTGRRAEWERLAVDWATLKPTLRLDASFSQMTARLERELNQLGHAWIRFTHKGVPLDLQPASAAVQPSSAAQAIAPQVLPGKLVVGGQELPLPDGSYWECLPPDALAIVSPRTPGQWSGAFYTWSLERQELTLQDLALIPAGAGARPASVLGQLARKVQSGDTPTDLVRRMQRAASTGGDWRSLTAGDSSSIEPWLSQPLRPVGLTDDALLCCVETADLHHRAVGLALSPDAHRLTGVVADVAGQSPCPGCRFEPWARSFRQAVASRDRGLLTRMLAPRVQVILGTQPPRDLPAVQLVEQFCTKGWLYRQMSGKASWWASVNEKGQVCGLRLR